MSTSNNTPLISKTAFACPHCGAYTTQFWYKTFVARYDDKDHRTPTMPDEGAVDAVKNDKTIPPEAKPRFIKWIRQMVSGKPFIEKSEASPYNPPILNNCNFTSCYNCGEVAVWVHDQMVYPSKRIDIQPNADLPDSIRALFDEARAVVDGSPKGAAALLRLCIQHLCIELGEPGKNLDSDIASLVSKGLNPLVQKALDVVRVIGNESVHPGEIDLNDNREVAVQLFGLVNLIAEQMISHPKHVERLYSGLPEGKLRGIEQRNAKAKTKSAESDGT